MLKILTPLTILLLSFTSISQEKADLFKSSDYKYHYVGIDYSHAKFIGDFSQFSASGTKSVVQIKQVYFESWNTVVTKEREKYDLEGSMRKENIMYDVDVSALINSKTIVENMEADYVAPFSQDTVQGFINGYNLGHEKGIAFMFVCEYLNKNKAEGCFHFLAINLSDKKIILHERMKGDAAGFGIRNYWIHPVHDIITQINKEFKKWKKEFEN